MVFSGTLVKKSNVAKFENGILERISALKLNKFLKSNHCFKRNCVSCQPNQKKLTLKRISASKQIKKFEI